MLTQLHNKSYNFMTKGNKTRLILTVITLGLLPFSFFVTKALYLQVGEDININISGSLESNTYSVNLYMPDGNGNYTLSNTYDIDTNSSTTINNIIENNGIEFNSINNYIYNGNIYNSDSIQTTHDLNTPIKSDIDLYPEYIGYFVQGFKDSSYQQRNGDMIQLEYYSNPSDGYDFSSMVDLGTQGDNYAARTCRVQYHTNHEDKVGEYNTLHTRSGKYKICYNSSNKTSSYLRYVEITTPDVWDTVNYNVAVFTSGDSSINCGERYWIPFSGTSDGSVTFGEKVEEKQNTFAFYIQPYQKYLFLVNVEKNMVSDFQYKVVNYSGKLEITSNNYSNTKFSFSPSSEQMEWYNTFNLV